MDDINITIWVVTQGDEEDSTVVTLNVDHGRAKTTFDQAAKEIEANRLLENPDGTLHASRNGLSWAHLEPHTVTASLKHLINAIATAEEAGS